MAQHQVQLLWPTEFPELTQGFGNNPAYYGQFGLPGHEGLDFKALHGTEIYACATGTVKLVAKNSGNYGTQVRISHTDEQGRPYETIYAHLLDTTITEGSTVVGGQLIGHADNTGNSHGDHLHLTLKYPPFAAAGYGGAIANPMPFLLGFGEKPMDNLACGNVIQVGLSDEAVMEIVDRLKPRIMTVTLRYTLAEKLLDAGVEVIYRRWPDDGANAGNFLTQPEAFVDWVAADAPAGAYISLPNEPALTQAFANATLRALKRATDIGRVAVFGNFPTGNPQPWEWPMFGPAIAYAKQHGHILGLHEYWLSDPLADYPFHFGRFLKVYETFGEANVPRIVMGEVGYAKGGDPYGGWSGNIPEGQMAQDIRTVHSLYRKYNIAYCLFSFGHWPTHNNDRGDFDVTQSNVIMQQLYSTVGDKAMSVALPVGSLVYEGKVASLPTGDSFRNIRSGPSTSYPDIGDLRVGDVVSFAQPVQYPQWYWLKRGSLEGWCAKASGFVIQSTTGPAPYDPVGDLKKIRADLDRVISQLE